MLCFLVGQCQLICWICLIVVLSVNVYNVWFTEVTNTLPIPKGKYFWFFQECFNDRLQHWMDCDIHYNADKYSIIRKKNEAPNSSCLVAYSP